MKSKIGNHANRDEAAEGPSRSRPVIYAPQNDDQKQPQQNRSAEETEFLTHHGKNEISVPFRQKGQTLLRPLQIVGPEQAAGSDRHLGLDGLITGAESIPTGVKKGQDSFLLIAFELIPEKRNTDSESDIDRQKNHLRKDAQPNEIQHRQDQ